FVAARAYHVAAAKVCGAQELAGDEDVSAIGTHRTRECVLVSKPLLLPNESAVGPSIARDKHIFGTPGREGRSPKHRGTEESSSDNHVSIHSNESAEVSV